MPFYAPILGIYECPVTAESDPGGLPDEPGGKAIAGQSTYQAVEIAWDAD